MKRSLDIVARHKRGEPVGVYSLCSAHPLVIEAALREAQARRCTAARSRRPRNQVNQFGGYTGHDARRISRASCTTSPTRVGVPGERVVARRRSSRSERLAQRAAGRVAMARAAGLVDAVRRGRFSQDPSRLLDGVRGRSGAARRSRRSRSAPRACAQSPSAPGSECGGEAPVYVIGTEVPVPGGADDDLHELRVTTPEAASATIAAHRERIRATRGSQTHGRA